MKPILGAAAVTAALLAAHVWGGEPPGKAAHDFTLPDLKGTPVSLSDFRGKVVLLDFWATWCGPCRREIPDLVKIHGSLQREGFAVIGVTFDEDRQDVLSVVAESRIQYPILTAQGDIAGYPFDGFPTAYLIDCKGRIVKEYDGRKEAEPLRQDVNDALRTCRPWIWSDLFGTPEPPPSPYLPTEG